MLAGSEKILADTGPLVAVMNERDSYHAWACQVFRAIEPPVFTCEAVLSEAQFLLQERGGDPTQILRIVRDGALRIDFNVAEDVERLIELQHSYRNVPMSLADASLVRMSERWHHCRVLTMDSDFRVYRRNRRQVIPLLTPADLSLP